MYAHFIVFGTKKRGSGEEKREKLKCRYGEDGHAIFRMD
jgi:hypothetical protein